jgi:ArsR family transcriptional regulator, lead/cadmium/zinc/bismuth-responsive transcriptional repressor
MSKRAYVPKDESTCDVRIVDPAAVRRASASVPNARDLKALADIFGALGDPTRLKILTALAAGPLCVCDLVEVVGVSQSGVSHQLRLLRDLDLVTCEREGRRAVYRLSDDHVRALLAQGGDHAAERTGERP